VAHMAKKKSDPCVVIAMSAVFPLTVLPGDVSSIVRAAADLGRHAVEVKSIVPTRKIHGE
jgi:hypothetical protein